jgi:hypothetical protein
MRVDINVHPRDLYLLAYGQHEEITYRLVDTTVVIRVDPHIGPLPQDEYLMSLEFRRDKAKESAK